MKKCIAILARQFPTTHSRRGEATGFKNRLFSGKKIHTIRGNYPLWKKYAEKINRGDFILSVREWSGKPYRSPQLVIMECNRIYVQPIEIFYHADDMMITAKIDGRKFSFRECYEIAKNDGFSSTDDFIEWIFGKFPNKHKTFFGCIVHFTNFKY